MLRYAFIVAFFNIFLVIRAHSQPLDATSDLTARGFLVDLPDDDILYTLSDNHHDYDTYYWPDETPYPYGGLNSEELRTHTGTLTSSTANTSTVTSISTSHPGKFTPTPAPATVTATHSTATTTSSEATSSVSGSTEQQSSSSASTSDAKQWKIIGLVVICITFIGVMILTIVFFDAWWGFLQAVICRRKRGRGRGIESMVPDWEKRSWEYKFTEEDGTFGDSNLNHGGSGLAGIGRGRVGDGRLPNPFDTPRPMPLYAPERDLHPLDPLTRRPSANARSPLNLPMGY